MNATEQLIAQIDLVLATGAPQRRALLQACRAQLLAMQVELNKQAPIIDEVHHRADKECCEEDHCDFTVTVTYEDYMALLS